MQPRGGPSNDWKGSMVVISSEYMVSSQIVGLAAALVHEFAHFQSFQSGKSCALKYDCTTLKNGVSVEEEVYATAAEARWWRAMYGPDGNIGSSYPYQGVRQMVEAYEAGDAYFFNWVKEQRSDPREGEGLD